MADLTDDAVPAFFTDVQTLAKEHGVIAYITVAVVHRNGRAVIASAGGSKLPDGIETTLAVYGSMSRSFDQMIDELTQSATPPGPLN